MDTAHGCANTHTTPVCLLSAAYSRGGGRGTPAARSRRQLEYRRDAVLIPMRQRAGGPPLLRVTCFRSLDRAAFHGCHTLHRALQGGSQGTDTSHTRAASPLTLPSALFASVLNMQEAENPGSTMLQQGTPQSGAHRPAPALENMRPPRTPAQPSLHTHAKRRTALLCPRASQSVHASTSTHQARRTARRPTPTPMPVLPRPLSLPDGALTTHPTHTACPQATETQDPPPPPPPRLRPPCHRECRKTTGWKWLAPCLDRGKKGQHRK